MSRLSADVLAVPDRFGRECYIYRKPLQMAKIRKLTPAWQSSPPQDATARQRWLSGPHFTLPVSAPVNPSDTLLVKLPNNSLQSFGLDPEALLLLNRRWRPLPTQLFVSLYEGTLHAFALPEAIPDALLDTCWGVVLRVLPPR